MMQHIELAVLDWMQRCFRCEFLDWLMPLVSVLSDHGEVWILCSALLLLWRRQRKYGVAAACALTLDLFACNLVLKPLVGRVRPFAFRPELSLLVSPPGDASFPSGHTAAAFAVVFALKTAGSPLWRPALALAAATAFSRLYLYVHWPSDILGGILLGAAVGWAGAGLAEVMLRKTGAH